MLRAIAICSVAWNFAFFALAAVFVPFALARVGLDARGIGLSQAAFGFGGVLGALTAASLLRKVSPRVVLVGGPLTSVLGALLFLAAPQLARIHPLAGPIDTALAYVLLGFGPMLWLVCQTSLRQLVTPAPLLGRVGATIQVAIYGVRPLGALAGGSIAQWASVDAAIGLVVVAFGASLVVAVASPLAHLGPMPAPAVAAA